MRLITYATYNARLETSFLVDECALPPQMLNEFRHSTDLFDSFATSPISPIDGDVKAPLVKTSSWSSVEKCAEAKEDHDRLSQIVNEVASPVASPENACLQLSNEILPSNAVLLESQTKRGEEDMHVVQSDRFRNVLNETLLSVSPFVSYSVPYLKTEAGSRCLLRLFYPSQIYWSKLLSCKSKHSDAEDETEQNSSVKEAVKSVVAFLPSHPFVVERIIEPVSHSGVQVMCQYILALATHCIML
jgi:1-phosphatidylinositol-3-phosphate 5-kinase